MPRPPLLQDLTPSMSTPIANARKIGGSVCPYTARIPSLFLPAVSVVPRRGAPSYLLLPLPARPMRSSNLAKRLIPQFVSTRHSVALSHSTTSASRKFPEPLGRAGPASSTFPPTPSFLRKPNSTPDRAPPPINTSLHWLLIPTPPTHGTAH